jgi:hypothetical protein
MPRIARLVLAAALIAGAAAPVAATAAESCRVSCFDCDDQGCLCAQVWVDGKPYGPCML